MATTRWKGSASLGLALTLLLYLLAGWNAPTWVAFAQTGNTENSGQAAQAALANRFSVAAGAGHTCALTSMGAAKCWGNNAFGQLGLGNTVEQDTPTTLSGLIAHLTALAAGNNHTCAFANSTGTVQCWGSNTHGQLGDGGVSKQRLTPSTPIVLPNAAAQIAAGGEHTCALLIGGGVYCWGNNASGQLNGTAGGDGPNPIPANVSEPAAQIVAGAAHTCALLQNGQVRCWGDNSFGQLGAIGNGNTPATVMGLPANVTLIAAGAWHTCALIGNGEVWCWGRNDHGQLGDVAQDNQSAPVKVKGLSGSVSAISLGEQHSCALRNGGRVLCWGGNADGMLGSNSVDDSGKPIEVGGLRDVQAIAAGGRHTCAILMNGNMRCWGRNFNGQMGNGENGRHVLPVPVTALGNNILSLVTASNHTCARLSNGDVKCWGLNDSGQLGDGTRINRNAPTSVQGLPFGVRILTADGHHTCVATALAAYCWGSNSDGQLGDGTTQDRLTPTQVVELGANISAMVIGDLHTCALLFNGAVRCWGDNAYGQLGDGSTEDRSRPVAVLGLDAPATSISAGAKHSCARLNNGVVKCWGDNSFGQLGDGTQNRSLAPVTVKGFENGGAAAVNASETHTCARIGSRNGGGMQCWGSNAFGQLGNGTTVDSWVPVSVAGLSGVSGMSVGRFHSCALSGGVFMCWGSNQFGQLGDGTLQNRSVPAPVSDLDGNITGYGAGGGQGCAILDGEMHCWGSDEFGQIGDGSPIDQLAPVAVLNFLEPQPVATDTPIAGTAVATVTPVPMETTVTVTPTQPDNTATPVKATATPKTTRTPTPTGQVLPPDPSVSYLPVALKQEAPFFEGPSESEPNNNSGEPNGPLRATRIYTGLANDSDDYFSFNVTQSGPVTITLSNHIAENTRNLQLQLRDSADRSLGFVFQAPFVIARTLPPGKYYIRIFYAPPGPYDNSVPFSLQVDFQ